MAASNITLVRTARTAPPHGFTLKYLLICAEVVIYGFHIAKTYIKVRSDGLKLKAVRIFGFKLLIGPIYGFQGIQQSDQVGVSHYIPNKRVIRKRLGWEPERKV